METNFQNPRHDLSTSKQADVVVVMVPFPEQSHLNQLLHLSLSLSSYNIPVHYACSTTHIHQAKLRFNDTTKPEFSQIHFHELPTPPFISPPPNPNSTTKFPSHLQPAFDSSLHLRHPMAALFQKLSSFARRVVVVHDMLMCYTVQDAATLPNAELYAFNPISAFSSVFSGTHMSEKPSPVEEPEGLPSSDGDLTSEILDFITLQIDFLKSSSGTIFNSCRSIEGTYLDLLEKEERSRKKQQWAVGPLNLGTMLEKRNSNSQHKCLEWLDKQSPNSVLYVCFGTSTSMTDEDIKELALGLEQSGQKFIWVLRHADKGNIFEGDAKRPELPIGYEGRVKEVGMVVRDWAPQLEILGHPSTGGFMSHCGWNSCLESITMGVPIVAWPMHSDQPVNAFLMTDILKVGLAVKKRHDDKNLVKSSVIANVVKTLMVLEEGKEMRKRAEELGGATRDEVKEGGVSRLELDSFIAHISR